MTNAERLQTEIELMKKLIDDLRNIRENYSYSYGITTTKLLIARYEKYVDKLKDELISELNEAN